MLELRNQFLFRTWASLATFVLVSSTFSLACTRKNASLAQDPNQIDNVQEGTYLVTRVSQASIAAGQQAQAECLLSVNGVVSEPDFRVRLVFDPVPDVLVPDEHTADFMSQTAGRYSIRCEALNESYIDEQGVQVDVVPLEATAWTYTVPDTPCLSASEVLMLGITATDRFGNVIPNPDLSTVVTPAEGWTGDVQSGIRFQQDGTYTVSVSYQGAQDAGSSIEPLSFRLSVDATPPVLSGSDTLKHAMLVTTPGSALNVEGVVIDGDSDIKRVSVNGVGAALDPSTYTFARDIQVQWGMNVVTLEAEDQCGNVAREVIPFLASDAYAPVFTEPNAAAAVPMAAIVQVNQDFIDDGDRSDEDDLATLIQNITGAHDFNASVSPGAILAENEYVECGSAYYKVRRDVDPNNVLNVDGIVVHDISFKGKALVVDLEVLDVDVPLEIFARLEECDSQGIFNVWEAQPRVWVGFDNFRAEATVELDAASGSASADLHDFNFSIDGLYLDLDCGWAQPACDAVLGTVENTVVNLIENEVENILRDNVLPDLADSMGSLTLTTEITIPAPINKSLSVETSLDRLSICGPDIGLGVPEGCHAGNISPGAINVALATQVVPAERGALISPTARGAILQPETSEPLFSTQSDSMAVSMNIDAINQALWAVWYGGTLSLEEPADLLGETLADAIDGQVHFSIPPVISLDQERGELVLGLGALVIEGDVNITEMLGGEGDPEWISIDVLISGNARANLDVAVSERVLSVNALPQAQLAVDFVQLGDLTYADALAATLADLVNQKVPELVGEIVQEFELPSFNLSELASLPDQSSWGLVSGGLDMHTGYVSISGQFGPLNNAALGTGD